MALVILSDSLFTCELLWALRGLNRLVRAKGWDGVSSGRKRRPPRTLSRVEGDSEPEKQAQADEEANG